MRATPLLLRGLLMLGLGSLAGCELVTWLASSPDPSMRREAVALREAPADHLFEGELAGERLLLLLHDCEVYRVERGKMGEVRWHSVLAPEPYPFWTACQREAMSVENGALTVTLGRMAFGAGGCCATGGTYRSVDGRHWKKVSESTVPRAPADEK